MNSILVLLLAAFSLLPSSGQATQSADRRAVMEAYNKALGVGCEFCHVPDDWTNTSKPPLAIARNMEQMVAVVNSNQLAGTSGVACWTCHAGQRTPSRLPPDALAQEAARWPASLVDLPDRAKLTMAVYDVTLGVTCDHCHEPGAWKSDAKPAFKTVARMNNMFDEFPKYMPATARTQCWMCHKGSTRPELAPPAAAAPAGASVEQTTQGRRPALALVSSFDGLGFGIAPGPGTSNPPPPRNPSDNTLAVGRDRIVQIVNSQVAVFKKSGEVVYGPVSTNTFFAGFGGVCEARPNGDAVARYDQLADRWLIVMPIFRRTVFGRDRSRSGGPAPPGQAASPGPAARPGPPPPLAAAPPPRSDGARAAAPPQPPDGTYAMCYAVSATSDPLGPYYRYAFERPLFPDYPRPAVWPDGYYVPTSTGDEVIQKHACVAERERMLRGEPAHEQCVVVDGVNFLNNADLDGHTLPPPGAPNIVLAAGGTQLKQIFGDNCIFTWKFHVDWRDPSKTALDGPVKIAVEPYHYLCNGQLSNCVPQPGTDRRLDAQGDKIMARLVYRNVGGREAVVAVHSIDTAAGGGGVRWYEFGVDSKRDLHLKQQGTYAPDAFYRWMASPAIDREGNIAIGYSFGGTPHFAGQRLAARLAADPPGQLTFHETVVAEGEDSQKSTLRWEDYTQTAIDPSDDCTIWYVGDYLKKDAPTYSTRIAALRMPGCPSAR
jgi:hypothetical protein